MKIGVASGNPVKIAAVRDAFAAQFPGVELQLQSVAVASGVDEQPMTDAETRRGARNRSIHAATARPDADYCVGLEGGIDTLDGQLMAFAWMAVRHRDGRISEARSVTLPLPPAVAELIARGVELGVANDRVFATRNSKQGGGAFGLLTDGQYTRQGIYRQTLIMALIPFVNERFAPSAARHPHS